MSTGYVPQEILDEIVARCDIVSVVNEYVPLKRKGSNYQGLCPFHNEKTPSFSVSPGKQIFHCFGCGKGGNVFRFIMDIEGVSFLEAVERLAKRANVTLPEKEMTAAQRAKLEQRKRYLKINNFAARYYQKILLETEAGRPYREYLQKRQIDEEIIQKFQLGATPSGWDNLYQNLKKRGVTTQEMLDLGLISVSRREGQYIDRFRNRLMFPIGNEKGEIIAFGGRIIDKDSSPQKYLNSPDTPLFHKSRNLYGLHLARNSIRNQDMAIIVEGYMDVISCHQHGITNAVAPLGTAFTPEQGRLLMRSTYQIGISFDGDAAGIKATMRCLDILSDLGATARVIQIPDQADPDEFLKKYGKEAFLQLIEDSQELVMYKIARYMETTNTDSIRGKMKVVEQLLPDLRKMQSAVARETAVRLVAAQLQVSEKAVWEEVRKPIDSGEHLRTETETVQSPVENEINAGKIESPVEKNILRILFVRPDLLREVEAYGGSELFGSAGAALYREFAASIARSGKVESANIAQEQSLLLAELLMEEVYMTDQEKALKDGLRQLKYEQLNEEYRQLTQQLMELEKEDVGEVGAKKAMQGALLQKLDTILQAKKEFETGRKGEK